MSMYPIATDIGSGGPLFVNIPQDFDSLRLIAMVRSTRVLDYDAFLIRFNEDISMSYTSRAMQSIGTSMQYAARSTTTNNINFMSFSASEFIPAATAPANSYGIVIADIFDYSNTSKFTTVRVIGGSDINSTGRVSFASGMYTKTDAITKLQTGPASTAATSLTRFDLYGIRGKE